MMARMLRQTAPGEFHGCCSHCDRKKVHKTARRERHLARQREKRQWRREVEA